MEEKRKYCVYKHTNKINGKVYIGQTGLKPERRWGNQGSGYKDSSYFFNAIQKYGWDNFEHEIISFNLTLEESNELEIELINKFDSRNPEKGYNLKSGGSNGELAESTKLKLAKAATGRKMSEYTKEKLRQSHIGKPGPMLGKKHKEETKKKISEATKGENNPNYGKKGEENPRWGTHWSEEVKSKISESHKGLKHSEESKEKMRKNHKDYSGENHPQYGTHRSEETKNKLRELNGYKVRCIETGVVYLSVRSAGKELGIDPTGISCCCRGKQKTAGGYHWEYI